MVDNQNDFPSPQEKYPSTRTSRAKQRLIIAGIVVALIIFLALIGLAVFYLLQNEGTTARIRDIFIIFMALESLLIGAALVILIIQVANILNLVQNEIRPILESTQETVNTLRGTTAFLSENMVNPVIKLNSYLAGLRRVFELFGKRK